MVNLKEIGKERCVELSMKMRDLYQKYELKEGPVKDSDIMSILNDSMVFCNNTNELALCWLTLGNRTSSADWKRNTVDLTSVSEERQDELAEQCSEIIKRYMADTACCTESKYSDELMNLANNKSELALVTIAGSRFFVGE